MPIQDSERYPRSVALIYEIGIIQSQLFSLHFFSSLTAKVRPPDMLHVLIRVRVHTLSNTASNIHPPPHISLPACVAFGREGSKVVRLHNTYYAYSAPDKMHLLYSIYSGTNPE